MTRDVQVRARGIVVIIFVAFALYATLIPVDPHNCTAHNSPIYREARIGMVGLWLALAAVLYARRWHVWSCPSFVRGGFFGGGFLIAILLMLWAADGRVDAMNQIRVIGSTATYAAISGLYAASRGSPLGAFSMGLGLCTAQMTADLLVHLPWACIY